MIRLLGHKMHPGGIGALNRNSFTSATYHLSTKGTLSYLKQDLFARAHSGYEYCTFYKMDTTFPYPCHPNLPGHQSVRCNSFFTKQKVGYEDRPWHNDSSFMEESSPEEKEQWLKSTLTNDRFKLNDIDGNYEIDINGARVDSEAYLFVLKALSTSKLNSAPQKCEELLSKLERKFDAAKEMYDQMQLNQDRREGERSMNQASMAIMKEIVLDLKPTTECYNEVIEAWSNTHNPIIARAERWLDTLRRNRDYQNKTLQEKQQQQQYQNGKVVDGHELDVHKKAVATTESYNLFLKTVSKGNAKKSQVLIDNATKAKFLLGEMMTIYDETKDTTVQPNTDSFNFVLRAITRCTSDRLMTQKLMDTLRVMELLQRNADDPDNAIVKPNSMTYCLAIDSFGIAAYQKATAAQNRQKSKKGIKWNEKNEENDPYEEIAKAESILKYMHDLHYAGNHDVVPNVVAYNTILSSYARISSETYNDAPMRAEGVLRKMIEMVEKEGEDEVKPDTRSFNAVIRCWANSKESNSGVRSEWWLRRMLSDEFENAQPDVHTYNFAILAYHNVCQTHEAEKLLKELIEIEVKGGYIRPNSESYSIVIRSWLAYVRKNEDCNGCHNAYSWLSTLLEREEKCLDVTSSPELFYQVIKTTEILSRKIQDKALLNIALKTFSKLQSSRHQLDEMSYRSLLKIGIQTLPGPLNFRQRTEFIRTVISSCCDDGLLSKHLIAVLKNQYNESNIGKDEVRVISQEFFNWPLPCNYSRNVKGQNLLPSKKDFAFLQ